MSVKTLRWFVLFLAVTLTGCWDQPNNAPYKSEEASSNITYAAFSGRPNHLDPARSYSANELTFTGQIYETPLQYAYLKRPYVLEPLLAAKPIVISYLDKDNKPTTDPKQRAYTVYTINIKSGIKFQPHPALTKDDKGNYLYHQLTPDEISSKDTLYDFEKLGTRELIAKDFVYQVKRLAHPQLHSPILGLMGAHILDLKALNKRLVRDHKKGTLKNLRHYSFAGAKVLDRYTYQIKLRGEYPQFIYWLAMPFFSPIPWEADHFYNQQGMHEKNITLDWYPLGTGPYYLTLNDPNRQMVLTRNPNFHGATYPTEGEPSDKENGLLKDAGLPLPFIDKAVFQLEKEAIPSWNKFLQGYYDRAGISADSFDQAINMAGSAAELTPKLKDKGIRLTTYVGLTTFYWGFNMLDPVVGGYTESARKLRHAVSIALNTEEFISIFQNGRGVPAFGPIPPGIFGYQNNQEGINPFVYDWVQGSAKRKSIEYAKKLLAEAGYPNGRSKKTGKPLILHYDAIASNSPDESARLSWFRKQLDKLSIQVHVRGTDYNRFQHKMIKGDAQIFFWGWNADYPDPENFLFLLYGPNGKVKHGGENAANYQNPEYDALFEIMKKLPNGEERRVILSKMLAIAREDAPWIWGFHPKNFQLNHSWTRPGKPNDIAQNTLKYARIDPELRQKLRTSWNQPIYWPILLVVLLFGIILLPVFLGYSRKEHQFPFKKIKRDAHPKQLPLAANDDEH